MNDIKKLIIDNVTTSFEDLAAQCKISRMTLFNVLNDNHKPTLKTVKKICNFLNVNFNDYYDK